VNCRPAVFQMMRSVLLTAHLSIFPNWWHLAKFDSLYLMNSEGQRQPLPFFYIQWIAIDQAPNIRWLEQK
jgi:hypothetical protein